MLPGVNAQALEGAEVDDRKVDRIEAIILSMTPEERRNPNIINASRKQRIAQGSGMKVQDVNALLKQFQMMQKMFKQMNQKKLPKSMRKKGKKGFRFPF